MIFARIAADNVVVDAWDEELLISHELIDKAPPSFLWREGDRIFFCVANGNAVYRITADCEGFRLLSWLPSVRAELEQGDLRAELEQGYQLVCPVLEPA